MEDAGLPGWLVERTVILTDWAVGVEFYVGESCCIMRLGEDFVQTESLMKIIVIFVLLASSLLLSGLLLLSDRSGKPKKPEGAAMNPEKPVAAAIPSESASPPVAGEKTGWSKLTPEESRVIVACGTEAPFSGQYWDHHESGVYTCKRCHAPLFSSTAKFDSGSGWPSFDDALPGAVKQIPDPDGFRTEIRCAKCGAHLGHVFRNEGFTAKQTRHCVNSLSLGFTKEPVKE